MNTSDVVPVACINKGALKRLQSNQTGSAKCFAIKDREPNDIPLYTQAVVFGIQATVDALQARIAELEKDAARWRKNIEMIRRKNGSAVTEEIIATVDAAIEASK